MMKIISVSRRTDIPAFYSEWFMNRIRDGYVRWVNPFSGLAHEESLRAEDVMAIVFWSKNYAPLSLHLNELDALGYRMIFHYTITGLPSVFEPKVPGAEETVESAKLLSERYGSDAVLWRYDPVVISSVTDSQYHLRRFNELCQALEGSVKRCYFSFAVFYNKVKRNASLLEKESGIVLRDLPESLRIDVANAFADVAGEHGIEMYSCCGDYLIGGKIKKAQCVDAALLFKLFPGQTRRLASFPTRKECGCCKCTDIGAYDTCPHACVYCYANSNTQKASNSFEKHDLSSDTLGLSKGVGSYRKPTKAHGSDNLTLDL